MIGITSQRLPQQWRKLPPACLLPLLPFRFNVQLEPLPLIFFPLEVFFSLLLAAAGSVPMQPRAQLGWLYRVEVTALVKDKTLKSQALSELPIFRAFSTHGVGL